MNNVEIFNRKVKQGEEGLEKGILFTHDRLNHKIGGITKNTYFLILGKSKSGKSSMAYDQFIFNIVDRAIKGIEFSIDDVEIYLYSYEITMVKIYAKAAARWLYINKGIVTHPKQILGMEGPADEGLYKHLYGSELQQYLAVIEKVVTILTNSNPVEMGNTIDAACKEQSEVIGFDKEGNALYEFKNPKKKMLVAIDHMSLVPMLNKTKLKESVDFLSNRVLRYFKEKYPITTVLIQQITPSGEPKKYYGHDDARDTKNTFQDCDVCISVNSPYHEGFEGVDYGGGKYYIKPVIGGDAFIGDNLRLLSIEKDRMGNSGHRVASLFIGQMGIFTNIEGPKKINYSNYKFKDTWPK